MDEKGYIKFDCVWIRRDPLPELQVAALNRWRDRLHVLRLVGSYDNGVGYGNLSERLDDTPQFIISGSATGRLPVLDGRHYTRVTNYDFRANSLTCEGPIKASSESLTHAAIYVAEPSVKAVIHVHSLSLWQALVDRLPTTSKDAGYGTPEMAAQMMKVLGGGKAKDTGIIVMGGHEAGIVTFGRDLDEAGEILMKYYPSGEC